ncbi:hypothetical protein ACNKHN_18235 [Shigella flexneri]
MSYYGATPYKVNHGTFATPGKMMIKRLIVADLNLYPGRYFFASGPGEGYAGQAEQPAGGSRPIRKYLQEV